MASDVFNFDQYQSYLLHRMQESAERGTLARWSEAAQCQRSHLSRVLAGTLHLTMEQAFRLAKYFHLDPDAENYFLKLVEFERAGDSRYKEKLKNELHAIRESQEDFSQRLNYAQLKATEQEILYYSNWYWGAIHILVSVPKYQKDVAIAQRLQLPIEIVRECLKKLEEFKLIEFKNDRWHFTSPHVHLTKKSPYNVINQSSWRNRAVIDTQAPNSDGLHYTVVQTMSLKDAKKIKMMLFQAIDDYTKIANPSREEELFCFNCDFFQV